MSFTGEILAEDIITDFLRVHLVDPRSRAEASTSETVTATAGQTTITLSPPSGSVSCITELTINDVAQSKWKDYYWDYQNEKITFFTALTLNDSVKITYKYGIKNWAYSDKPDENLSATSFPRIEVSTINSPGRRLGRYDAPVEMSHYFQIDIWSKDNYTATVSSRTYSNEYLVRYYGNKITKAFEDNEDDLFPLLYNYVPVSGPKTAPYSERYQAYHSIVEINLRGLRSGRIEVT
jgi:hypothetical protein